MRPRRIFRGFEGKNRAPIRRVMRIRRRMTGIGMCGLTGLRMGSLFSVIGNSQLLLMWRRPGASGIGSIGQEDRLSKCTGR
jgi:hypothetical protein